MRNKSRRKSGGKSEGKPGGKSDVAEFDLVAAVDLGSNSFHAVIARLVHGELTMIDRVKERVRLGAGLDESKNLKPQAEKRALEALERLGQRLRHMPAGSVRAVGTNTLRQAKNSRRFLDKARQHLGHAIEIISGREEARLIYLGVSHMAANQAGRNLVVDIGGGSTEIILGERFEPIEADSLHMGCVSWSQRFFPGGRVTAESYQRAEVAAALELRSIRHHYRALGWDRAVGASGTVKAIDELGLANGWSKHGITVSSMREIRQAAIAAGHVMRLELSGLKETRAPVLPGGLAILEAIFRSLAIERMTASNGALREGALYDLLGRLVREDVRHRTIRNFAARYTVDLGHAERVESSALAFLDLVAEEWGLFGDHMRLFLSWAARLHEIGLSVSYSGYQKHGAYLVGHADMPGFSHDDQQVLAALVGAQRRKLHLEPFMALPPLWVEPAQRLAVLLRLSVLLNRSRSPGEAGLRGGALGMTGASTGVPVDGQTRGKASKAKGKKAKSRRSKAQPVAAEDVVIARPDILIRAHRHTVQLTFPEGWLDEHPLTRVDLEVESDLLRAAGFKLEVSERG